MFEKGDLEVSIIRCPYAIGPRLKRVGIKTLVNIVHSLRYVHHDRAADSRAAATKSEAISAAYIHKQV